MGGVVGKGRPYVGPKVEVRIPDELLAAIDALAAENELSRLDMIRRLLQEALQ